MEQRLSNHRLKVVIGHPYIGRGGSESIVMRLIETLRRDCDVTVVTTGGWDREALNRFYGTIVLEHEVTVRIAPVPWLLRNHSAAALRAACYQRYALRIAPQYDLRISAYNLTDWGLPAIHFLADFSWSPELREQLDPPSPGFIYRDSLVRRAYLGIASVYETPSGRNVLRDDQLIANSHWTAELVRQSFDVDCAAVIYPPVWETFPDIAWEDRTFAFAMIGRIAPEKQVERVIAILHAVRRSGHAIHFHLCGQIPNNEYGKLIAHLCREHTEWITAEGEVSGTRKATLLAGCRFGIQARNAEPFGIAVAEMVKAGAIVFAPNDGGPTEILNHPDLLFANVEDAVKKISAVLSSSDEQRRLRAHLAGRAQKFGVDTFMKESIAVLTSSARLEPCA
jgi:glycosyltransferase involved in cell wall biosynthesis